MTRGAFLFKLLAAVGIGQGIANAPVSVQCLEEKCPLGHCQKATRIYPVEYNAAPASFESEQFVDTSGKLHVCSICGVVYVLPVKS